MLAYAGSGGRACMLDTAVILIREFRSPGRSADGFVHELPGGSTFKPNVRRRPRTALAPPSHRRRLLPRPSDRLLDQDCLIDLCSQSDFYQTASDELFEETGVRVAKDRLRLEASRQVTRRCRSTTGQPHVPWHMPWHMPWHIPAHAL